MCRGGNEIAAQKWMRARISTSRPLSRGLRGQVANAPSRSSAPFSPPRGQPGRRPLAVVSSGLERALVGDPRFGHRTEVVEDLAVEAGEREAIGGLAASARPRSVSPGRARTGSPRPGRGQLEIGARRRRILGPIEVLGPQY